MWLTLQLNQFTERLLRGVLWQADPGRKLLWNRIWFRKVFRWHLPLSFLLQGLRFPEDYRCIYVFNFIAVQLYVNHAGTDTMCFIIHDKYPPMCYTRYMNIRSHSNREESTCKEKLRFPIIWKRVHRGIHRYSKEHQCLTFVHGVGDNVQDNRKCL